MKTLILILTVSAFNAWAQAPDPKLNCSQTRFFVNGLVPYCEIRELSIPFSGALSVRGINGSISVQPWDGPDVLVRVQVQTTAENEFLAAALAGLVIVDSSNSVVLIGSGPSTHGTQGWSENFEIYVPAQAAISVTTVNGSISISDILGAVQFKATNGSVTVLRAGGNVEGQDVNGSIFVGVGGDHWQGQTLDVKTVNGKVELDVPSDCSAHVELSTVMGSVSTNFPVSSWGAPGLGRKVFFDLGAGGPLVRAATVMGSVQLKRMDP